MKRFMLVTFAFLAWAFYVMSGGADFDPDRARAGVQTSDPLKSRDITEQAAEADPERSEDVTRVSLNLTSVEDVLAGRDGTAQTGDGLLRPDERETRVAALPQVDAPAVTPSLAESATASTEPERILPSLIQGATPQAETSDTALALQPAGIGGGDIRTVTGSRVNVRGGPGTNYGVVSGLVAGDRVEVLDDNGAGWVRMRPVDGGTVGWMADFLLSDG